MIIVEGPDGGGKTSLARQLSAYMGLPIAPRVVSKEATAMTNLKVWTEQNVAKGFQHTIFDRHRLISQPIYGPILKPDSPSEGFMDYNWVGRMMELFYDARPLIVFTMPRLETVMANIENDPDNTVVKDHIKAIYQGYVARAAIETARDPEGCTIYNYETDGREDNPLACFNNWDRIIDNGGRRHARL